MKKSKKKSRKKTTLNRPQIDGIEIAVVASADTDVLVQGTPNSVDDQHSSGSGYSATTSAADANLKPAASTSTTTTHKRGRGRSIHKTKKENLKINMKVPSNEQHLDNELDRSSKQKATSTPPTSTSSSSPSAAAALQSASQDENVKSPPRTATTSFSTALFSSVSDPKLSTESTSLIEQRRSYFKIKTPAIRRFPRKAKDSVPLNNFPMRKTPSTQLTINEESEIDSVAYTALEETAEQFTHENMIQNEEFEIVQPDTVEMITAIANEKGTAVEQNENAERHNEIIEGMQTSLVEDNNSIDSTPLCYSKLLSQSTSINSTVSDSKGDQSNDSTVKLTTDESIVSVPSEDHVNIRSTANSTAPAIQRIIQPKSTLKYLDTVFTQQTLENREIIVENNSTQTFEAIENIENVDPPKSDDDAAAQQQQSQQILIESNEDQCEYKQENETAFAETLICLIFCFIFYFVL